MAVIDGKRTLGDLRKSHSTKQSFRKAIQMDAKQRYLANNGQMVCKVCGESRVIDICHIKPISQFSEDTNIEEINNPDNLIALCPTHHRILDKKIREV
jgi:predicted restriction endonuclease